MLLLAVVGLIVGSGLPAGAVDRTRLDVAGISSWAASLEVVGLDTDDAQAIKALWGEFVTGLPAQAQCLLANPPVIEANSNMSPRAAYAPSISTLYVKPGDVERLVVFHELAHHLDFTCGAADAIGPEFRGAQGISASKPWWQDGSPATWPAEYFANAVAVSLGEHSRHGVTAAAVEVVSVWSGRTQSPPEPVPPLTLDEPGAITPRLV
jgi:hypothetical protein